MGRRVAPAGWSCEPPMRPACPSADTIEPGLSITAEARSRTAHTGGMPRRGLRPALLSGGAHRDPSSANGPLTFAVRIGRRHPRGRPVREADGPPGASRLLRKGRRDRGPAGARPARAPPLACEACPRPERDLGVSHGEVAANEVWRGRHGRRRNTTEGARCEEALPAGSADCDRHADNDGDCPTNLRRRRDGDATDVAMATLAPDHVRPRAPRRDEREHRRARGEDADLQRRPAVGVPASACREPYAAHVGHSTRPSPDAPRAGCGADHYLRVTITTMNDSCESVAPSGSP